VENKTDSMHIVCLEYQRQGFEKDTVSILMNSWRTGTKKQYEPYLKKWFEYARLHSINPYKPDIQKALAFLTILFNNTSHRICL